MKKIAASVGLIALGASCLHAADEPYVSADAGKPWTVSATLRGFYDDNINTVSSGTPNHESSFGFAVSPAVSWSWQREQNTISLSYMYSLLYFDKRPQGNTSNYDQDHTFNGSFQHAFNERFQMQATDSFVIGQEPDTLRSGDALTSSQRVSGDNIRNYGTFTLTSQFTPTFGLESGYNNAYFNYDDSGGTVTTNGVFPSSSGTSDRIEQSIHVDARWQILPQTIGVLGYQFSWSDYTGDEFIGFVNNGTNAPTPVMSDSRNSRSHYIYVGADQTFNPDLQGSARVGVRLTDYYNDPSDEKTTSPYVRLGLNYRYAPESYLESGFSFDQNSTDIVGAQGGGLTVGQESAVLFSTLHHRITSRLFGTLTGTYQNSWFVGGDLDGEAQQYYVLGVSLKYRFTPNFSAETGYDYTKVEAPDGAGPSYHKNTVYIGITGSY